MALSPTANVWRKIKRSIAFGGRSYLVRTNHYWCFYGINCAAYRVMEQIIRINFCKIPGVVSAYLAHGRALGEIFPGLSDFDLILVFDPEANATFVADVRQLWNRIRQIIPVRDVSLMTRADFKAWQGCGGGMDPLDELQHWILLGGEDLRDNRLIDLNTPAAERDRQRYSFASYHRLLRCALKDEAQLHFLLISLRRQLYKSFCSAVAPLQRSYLTLSNQVDRLRQWTADHEKSGVGQKLLALRESQFSKGEVSRLSFEAAARAYCELDKSAQVLHVFPPCATASSAAPSPLFNAKEIDARARRFTDELRRMYTDRFRAAYIVGNGSPRGYALHIILSDGLSCHEVAETLRHIHEVFRLFDDPWFNEHYPSGVPLVSSESMWRRTLELWPSYASYWQRYPIVLFGEAQNTLITRPASSPLGAVQAETEGERSALSRYYYQAAMEASRPAYFDLLTLHLPRYLIRCRDGTIPTTNEEAVAELERIHSPLSHIARETLTQFGTLDIDAILRQIPLSVFPDTRCLVEGLLAPSRGGPK